MKVYAGTNPTDGRVIRTATAIVWFYAGANRYRRAVHLDDLTPAALTIMAESLSERGTGPADRSPGAGADAWGSGEPAIQAGDPHDLDQSRAG
jgi:hypothetical protein